MALGPRDVEKDYYAALGVAKDADAAAIKKAYRKLARELHPDKNPDDSKAEARFKEVSEAYDVLSDDARRKEYDEMRSLFAGGGRPGGYGTTSPGGFGGPGAGGGMTFDLNDLLNRSGGAQAGGAGGLGGLFGDLFSGGGRTTGRAPRRGDDLLAELTIGFDDAMSGVEATVHLPGAAACAHCAGLGTKPGTVPRTCPTCQGLGIVSSNQGGFAFSEPCRDCRGKGQIIDEPCPVCHGSGRQERIQRIRVPAGVSDGQKLRVRGKGAPGERGGPAGDLEVLVHVTPHAVFGREEGGAVSITVPVTYPEAALGAQIKVPTPDGSSVTVKVPAGTASGRKLRVRGRGAPTSGGGKGDLLVTVDVIVPSTLSDAARKALEDYAAEAATSGADPRAHLNAMIGG
jgi:molecular chaperone DnaJ